MSLQHRRNAKRWAPFAEPHGLGARISGVHVVSCVVEDFGSLDHAGPLMELDSLRRFFAFLGSTDTAVLMIRTRSDLDRLEAEKRKGSTTPAMRWVAHATECGYTPPHPSDMDWPPRL